MTIAKLLVLGTAALSLAGCTDWAGYDIDVAAGKVPQLATMRRSVIPDPYEALRLPPDGTVPVAHPLGDIPPPYTQAQLDSAAATLTNPLQPTPDVLARGAQQYHTNCYVCHGEDGGGKGPVIDAQKFPYAPPINGAATAGRSDGYLYAVIDVGRGLMPAYGGRMTHLDRWAVVTYVRQLQRGAGVTPRPGATPAGATVPTQTQPPPAQTVGQLPAAARDSAPPLDRPAPAATPQNQQR